MTNRSGFAYSLDHGHTPDIWAADWTQVLLPRSDNAFADGKGMLALDRHARTQLDRTDLPPHQRTHYAAVITAVRNEFDQYAR